jgi:tetratricopeptide (TPR) repeat protein
MPGREDVFQKAMNDGHSAAWDQQWDKAVASYQKALDEFPDNPKAMNSLGLALLQLNRFDEALGIYRKVSVLSPEDPVPLEKVAQLSERLGDLKNAVDGAMKAAELYLTAREIDKAIENWVRVTQLNPDHVMAHSRLAMAHERLGHLQQAVTEYLAVASLLQRSGNADKTTELVNKANTLLPTSNEARQAAALLKSGQLLPKPVRPKGGTGPIRMAQVKQMESTTQPADSGLDPVSEARKIALTKLAEVLFEYTDDSPSAQERRGLQSIMKGTGMLSMQQTEQTKIILHLGQAIDAQSHNHEEMAAEELERALEAGFNHPALYFDLGYLRSKGDRLESALRHLQRAVKHHDFALGTRLVMGQVLAKSGRYKEAAVEYLDALKLADAEVVPPDQSDAIRQLYEPMIEAQATQDDEKSQKQLCENVGQLLNRANWRDHLRKTREQLPKQQDSDTPMPLAEIILQAQSSQVLDSMNRVHQLARAGRLRSAMDEAFQSITHAPTYLPLHSLIGELLIQDNRMQDAIAKFTVVAQAYSVRGESVQAAKILRRVVELAPMELGVRTRLIDQLSALGKVDEAVKEYLELADIHYRLASLDISRKTLTTALRLVQQGGGDRSWNVIILQRMADIDMQRLDWKQAMRVFEQIRTLKPDDKTVRNHLIDLNFRMAQPTQAVAELEGFMAYLESNGHSQEAIPFLEELVAEHDKQASLRTHLAEQYRRAGRVQDAVAQLDTVAEILLNANDRPGAIQAISTIVAMNPPNVEDYRQLLAQLGA